MAVPGPYYQTKCLVGFFLYWKHHISYLGVLILHIYWVSYKAANCEWGTEWEQDLQYAQAAMQATLPLGQYSLADPMALVVTVANKDAVWGIFQAPVGDSLIIFPLNTHDK